MMPGCWYGASCNDDSRGSDDGAARVKLGAFSVVADHAGEDQGEALPVNEEKAANVEGTRPQPRHDGVAGCRRAARHHLRVQFGALSTPASRAEDDGVAAAGVQPGAISGM
jgi:hypothetical protein